MNSPSHRYLLNTIGDLDELGILITIYSIVSSEKYILMLFLRLLCEHLEPGLSGDCELGMHLMELPYCCARHQRHLNPDPRRYLQSSFGLWN